MGSGPPSGPGPPVGTARISPGGPGCPWGPVTPFSPFAPSAPGVPYKRTTQSSLNTDRRNSAFFGKSGLKLLRGSDKFCEPSKITSCIGGPKKLSSWNVQKGDSSCCYSIFSGKTFLGLWDLSWWMYLVCYSKFSFLINDIISTCKCIKFSKAPHKSTAW